MGYADMAGSGQNYGIVWQDSRDKTDGAREIYFSLQNSGSAFSAQKSIAAILQSLSAILQKLQETLR